MIPFIKLKRPQCLRWLARIALIQLGDQFQVMDQGAELGSRAQIQADALVNIQRLLVVVGLDAQPMALWATLIQREAIDDAVEVVLVAQQMLTDEAGSTRLLARPECIQRLSHGLLDRWVDRTHDGQVEVVEVIEVRHTQVVCETSPDDAGGLLARKRSGIRSQSGLVQGHLYAQRRVAPGQRNHTLGRHEAQVAIRQRLQRGVAVPEVKGWPPLRQKQTEDLPIRHSVFGAHGLGVGHNVGT